MLKGQERFQAKPLDLHGLQRLIAFVREASIC